MTKPRKTPSPARTAAGRGGRPNQFQQDQKQENRKKLLDAAARLFGKKPFALVTIDDIARAAKVSRPTFYLHFKSKFEIVIALNSGNVEDTFAFYDDFAAGGDFSEEHIRRWLENILRQYTNMPQLILTLLEVEAADGAFYHQLLDFHGDLIRRLAKHIPAFKVAAEDPNGEAWLRAQMLLNAIDFFCVAIGVRNTRFDKNAALRMLAKEIHKFIADVPQVADASPARPSAHPTARPTVPKRANAIGP